MDDRFLNDLNREPRPEFARDLRRRLRAAEAAEAAAPAWRRAPVLAAAASVAVVAALFAFPSVRAQAQSLLDLFRVRQFTAVEFDESRMERFRALEGQDGGMLVFDRQEVLQEPGAPVEQPSVAAAEAAVGFRVETPAYVPDGIAPGPVTTHGEGRVRMAVSEAKLRELLGLLDLRDVDVPAGLDGQWIEVHKAPTVHQAFKGERSRVLLVQGPSPDVTLPPGVDLARLGEIGLRILGLDRDEARRVAAGIDWRSTLVVPVPANAGSFREVTVQGNRGLLVTMVGTNDKGRERREGATLLWTEGDRVFALAGNIDSRRLVEMAESLR